MSSCPVLPSIAKSANAKSANAKSANAKSANAKSANAKSANAKSVHSVLAKPIADFAKRIPEIAA
jgi:hypothetical protein